jgi:hypothetical protein
MDVSKRDTDTTENIMTDNIFLAALVTLGGTASTEQVAATVTDVSYLTTNKGLNALVRSGLVTWDGATQTYSVA